MKHIKTYEYYINGVWHSPSYGWFMRTSHFDILVGEENPKLGLDCPLFTIPEYIEGNYFIVDHVSGLYDKEDGEKLVDDLYDYYPEYPEENSFVMIPITDAIKVYKKDYTTGKIEDVMMPDDIKLKINMIKYNL